MRLRMGERAANSCLAGTCVALRPVLLLPWALFALVLRAHYFAL